MQPYRRKEPARADFGEGRPWLGSHSAGFHGPLRPMAARSGAAVGGPVGAPVAPSPVPPWQPRRATGTLGAMDAGGDEQPTRA